MSRNFWLLAAAAGVLAAIVSPDLAFAQKQSGTLKVYFFDSPASMSIHEEVTIAAEGPMMGVFNNLVMYKQDVPQSGLQSADIDNRKSCRSRRHYHRSLPHHSG